jgi:hypothetical protein
MITYLACTCGEIHPSALIERDIGYICGNCEATAEGMPPIDTCCKCGQKQPCQGHHVDGHENSDAKAPLCINCHHKLHRGEEVTPIAVRTIRRKLKAKQ